MRLVSIFTAAVVAASMLVLSGCGTTRKPRPLSVAVAITTTGAEKVSTAQMAQIYQALRPEIEGAGYIFAERNATADLVLTVRLAPNAGAAGGHIKLTSLEPTDEFRRAMEGSESAESKQWRRLERELQATAEALGRNLDSR